MNVSEATESEGQGGPRQAVGRALAASLLAELPPAARERLLADSLPVTLPAGSTIYHDDDDPRCVLVVSGLVRVYVSAPDGRTVTIRYARPGELLGVPAIAGGPMPVSVRMLAEAELLFLNARTLRTLAETEPGIGWLLAREVATRLAETIEAFADNAFGSLRQRIARHLLDLATPDSAAKRLFVAVTQQELAEAVGSVRPAVARVIAELRDERLIATSPRGIAILDPIGLHAQTWSRHLSPE